MMKKKKMKIKFDSNDDLPLRTHNLVTVIAFVLHEGNKRYP